MLEEGTTPETEFSTGSPTHSQGEKQMYGGCLSQVAHKLSALGPRGQTKSAAAKRTTLVEVTELVDEPDPKSGSGNRVRVRFSLAAPIHSL